MRVLPLEAGFTWWREAFELFKQDAWAWIGAVIVFMIVCLVVVLVPLLGALLLHVVQTIMIGGLMLGCRDAQTGGRFTVGSLFSAFRAPYVVPLAIMACIVELAFVLFFLVLGIGLGMLGLAFSIGHVFTPNVDNLPLIFTLLLILVAAVSAVGMFYWFAPALIVFHNVGPLDALRLSFVASLRNIAPMLSFGIVSVVLLFAGVVTAGLALIVIAPMGFAAIYTSTRSVFGAEIPTAQVNA